MTKYLLSGQEVQLVGKVGNKFVVTQDYETEYGSRTGEEFFVDEVFNSPPVEKIHAEIEKLYEQMGILQADKLAAELAVEQAKNSRDIFLKKCIAFGKLKHLNDFIEKRITHYVEITPWFGCDIIEFKEQTSDEDEYRAKKNRELKLLTLFGKTNGELCWKLSQYSDGSGMSREVIPCTSYEEALETCRREILARIESSIESPRSWLLENAIKYGVEVPLAYANAVYTDQIKSLEDSARKEFLASQERDNKLAELKSKIVVLQPA